MVWSSMYIKSLTKTPIIRQIICNAANSMIRNIYFARVLHYTAKFMQTAGMELSISNSLPEVMYFAAPSCT